MKFIIFKPGSEAAEEVEIADTERNVPDKENYPLGTLVYRVLNSAPPGYRFATNDLTWVILKPGGGISSNYTYWGVYLEPITPNQQLQILLLS